MQKFASLSRSSLAIHDHIPLIYARRLAPVSSCPYPFSPTLPYTTAMQSLTAKSLNVSIPHDEIRP